VAPPIAGGRAEYGTGPGLERPARHERMAVLAGGHAASVSSLPAGQVLARAFQAQRERHPLRVLRQHVQRLPAKASDLLPISLAVRRLILGARLRGLSTNLQMTKGRITICKPGTSGAIVGLQHI
jgi:hypothetical protein